MPTVYRSGLEIDCTIGQTVPGDRMHPPEPGEMSIDAIAVVDTEDARDLFERLGLDPATCPPEGEMIPESGEYLRVHDWARTDEDVYREATTR